MVTPDFYNRELVGVAEADALDAVGKHETQRIVQVAQSVHTRTLETQDCRDIRRHRERKPK